jgi:hypothetical protein
MKYVTCSLEGFQLAYEIELGSSLLYATKSRSFWYRDPSIEIRNDSGLLLKVLDFKVPESEQQVYGFCAGQLVGVDRVLFTVHSFSPLLTNQASVVCLDLKSESFGTPVKVPEAGWARLSPDSRWIGWTGQLGHRWCIQPFDPRTFAFGAKLTREVDRDAVGPYAFEVSNDGDLLQLLKNGDCLRWGASGSRKISGQFLDEPVIGERYFSLLQNVDSSINSDEVCCLGRLSARVFSSKTDEPLYETALEDCRCLAHNHALEFLLFTRNRQRTLDANFRSVDLICTGPRAKPLVFSSASFQKLWFGNLLVLNVGKQVYVAETVSAFDSLRNLAIARFASRVRSSGAARCSTIDEASAMPSECYDLYQGFRSWFTLFVPTLGQNCRTNVWRSMNKKRNSYAGNKVKFFSLNSLCEESIATRHEWNSLFRVGAGTFAGSSGTAVQDRSELLSVAQQTNHEGIPKMRNSDGHAPCSPGTSTTNGSGGVVDRVRFRRMSCRSRSFAKIGVFGPCEIRRLQQKEH